MSNNNLKKQLEDLDITPEIIQKLNQQQIISIEQLWKLKRKNLKEMGLSDTEVKHISIKLQLRSLDLNQKIYHRN